MTPAYDIRELLGPCSFRRWPCCQWFCGSEASGSSNGLKGLCRSMAIYNWRLSQARLELYSIGPPTRDRGKCRPFQTQNTGRQTAIIPPRFLDTSTCSGKKVFLPSRRIGFLLESPRHVRQLPESASTYVSASAHFSSSRRPWLLSWGSSHGWHENEMSVPRGGALVFGRRTKSTAGTFHSQAKLKILQFDFPRFGSLRFILPSA
jgi:hypothetical protein